MSPVVIYISVDDFFNPFNICILTLLLHIYDVSSYHSIFLCLIPTKRLLKKAKPCRRFITCLYITVSNYSAVAGICMVLLGLKSRITQTWKYSMHEDNQYMQNFLGMSLVTWHRSNKHYTISENGLCEYLKYLLKFHKRWKCKLIKEYH